MGKLRSIPLARLSATVALTICATGPAGAAPSSPDRASTAQLEKARLEARLTADGELSVRIRYDVLPGAVRVIPLTAAYPARAEIRRLRVTEAGGEELAFRYAGEAGRHLGEVELSLAPSVPAEPAEPVSLRVEYDVTGASRTGEGGWKVVLPVVAIAWPPRQSGPETFNARLELPYGDRIFDSFPTRFDLVYEEGDVSLFEAELPAVPAFLRFSEGSPKAGPVVRPGLGVDIAVAVLLAWLGLFGWRRFRSLSR